MSLRRIYYFATTGVLLSLAACSSPGRGTTANSAPSVTTSTVTTGEGAAVATATPTTVPTQPPITVAPEISPTPTSAAQDAPTPLSFTPATYTDTSGGFAFDYPADWTLAPSSQVGVRGGEALLLSPGSTLEALADGGTRISITTYLWDPKRDLTAYVSQRKSAWEASGFTLVREDGWQLADGRDVRAFVLKTPELPTFWLLTTIGDDYLQISGEGDLALAEEIAHTLRPLD